MKTFLPDSPRPSSSSLDKESIIIIALSTVVGLGLYILKIALFPGGKDLVWHTKLGEPIFRSACKRFEIKMLHGHSSKECEVVDKKNPNVKKVLNNLKECKEWANSVK